MSGVAPARSLAWGLRFWERGGGGTLSEKERIESELTSNGVAKGD